jgi:hypothetical protein
MDASVAVELCPWHVCADRPTAWSGHGLEDVAFAAELLDAAEPRSVTDPSFPMFMRRLAFVRLVTERLASDPLAVWFVRVWEHGVRLLERTLPCLRAERVVSGAVTGVPLMVWVDPADPEYGSMVLPWNPVEVRDVLASAGPVLDPLVVLRGVLALLPEGVVPVDVAALESAVAARAADEGLMLAVSRSSNVASAMGHALLWPSAVAAQGTVVWVCPVAAVPEDVCAVRIRDGVVVSEGVLRLVAEMVVDVPVVAEGFVADVLDVALTLAV